MGAYDNERELERLVDEANCLAEQTPIPVRVAFYRKRSLERCLKFRAVLVHVEDADFRFGLKNEQRVLLNLREMRAAINSVLP